MCGSHFIVGFFFSCEKCITYCTGTALQHIVGALNATLIPGTRKTELSVGAQMFILILVRLLGLLQHAVQSRKLMFVTSTTMEGHEIGKQLK